MNTMNNNVSELISCDNCGCVDETFVEAIVDGERRTLCMDCVERLGLVRCEDCGVYHTPYVDMTKPDGYVWVCDDCLDDHWVMCQECGDYIREDDATEIGGDYYCDYCTDRYFHTCERCGTLSRYTRHLSGGIGYACEDCFDELTENFHDYSYKPSAEFHRETDDCDDCLMFGVESELDSFDDDACHYTMVNDVCKTGAPIYCKHDGSLGDEGVEIVTHPCSLAYHANSFGWASVYRAAARNGYFAENTCGLHIHVGREQMGDDRYERRNVAGKIVLIVNRIWDWLVDFSRRDEAALSDWCSKPIVSDDSDRLWAALATEDDGRYQAVNLTNRGTVEFRIFAGSDDAVTTVAAIQLTNSIVRYAMSHDVEECDNVYWSTIRDYIEYPELTEYLSRIGM